ncbi:NUDIX hydrolase [Streptomyces anandii]|uniref:NUDIX hydrolase n=1 Tax=Streptomyces anandii TaxID=285454 RepID=UPI00378E863C
MGSKDAVRGTVEAVVVDDGRLLLVERPGGWGLPSGSPEPAERASATAARVVYELTGYLVDGSTTLRSEGAGGGAEASSAVVCHLLSTDPSAEARLGPEQVRWTPFEETAGAALPRVVRDYLGGHTPV